MEIKVLGQSVDIGFRAVNSKKLEELEARGIQVGDVSPAGSNTVKFLGGDRFEGFDREGKSLGIREIPADRLPGFLAGFLVQQCFVASGTGMR